MSLQWKVPSITSTGVEFVLVRTSCILSRRYHRSSFPRKDIFVGRCTGNYWSYFILPSHVLRWIVGGYANCFLHRRKVPQIRTRRLSDGTQDLPLPFQERRKESSRIHVWTSNDCHSLLLHHRSCDHHQYRHW